MRIHHWSRHRMLPCSSYAMYRLCLCLASRPGSLASIRTRQVLEPGSWQARKGLPHGQVETIHRGYTSPWLQSHGRLTINSRNLSKYETRSLKMGFVHSTRPMLACSSYSVGLAVKRGRVPSFRLDSFLVLRQLLARIKDRSSSRVANVSGLPRPLAEEDRNLLPFGL